MAKHTPGPWKVFQWEDGSQKQLGLYNVVSDLAEQVIVKDIPLVDANLIAASPDLFDCLSRFRSLMIDKENEFQIGGTTVALAKAQRLFRDMEAAWRKAEGL